MAQHSLRPQPLPAAGTGRGRPALETAIGRTSAEPVRAAHAGAMASGCPAAFGDPTEVREGFLCPLCLKDLQAFRQLQAHYEEQHPGEDRDVRAQLRNLVQKAKRAKKKLLKQEDDDRTDSGSQERYESFSYGGVDPYMWEPQEVGAMRSHLSEFKKHRAARIDHYVVEVNKLIIRLEKLTSFDRANTESAKIRAIEKSVVPWVSDQDVPFCPDCGSKFSIRNRRHHCRLCGSIMCKKCMEFVSLPLASKLTSASKEALGSHTSPNSSPSSVHGSRRGSISSISSASSVLDEKDDERIRCCQHCKDTLLKREQQIDEKEYTPEIVKLYEQVLMITRYPFRRVHKLPALVFMGVLVGALVGEEKLSRSSIQTASRFKVHLAGKLRLCMEKVDQKAPEYIRMAESLNAGETAYNLDHANDLRVEIQKMYEFIDALSKKILSLGLHEDPQPHPKILQLQRMIRYSATLFVQEKLLGLMSLPTKDQYEELKKKRLHMVALETQGKQEEKEEFISISASAVNGDETYVKKGTVRKSEGWLPTSSISRESERADPLLQQIDNITSFIKQAKAANRIDEVHTLQENLMQLQDEYDQQQTLKAIELSKKQAEEEEIQREELQVLREKEWEREHHRFMFQHSRTCSLDFREVKQHLDVTCTKGDTSFETPAVEQLPAKEHLTFTLKHQNVPQFDKDQDQPACLNPFEDEADTPQVEEDPSNPFAKDVSPVVSFSNTAQQSDKKEYNPFESEEEDEQSNGAPGSTSNPFEEDENPFEKPGSSWNPGNPFEEGSSINPFEVEDGSEISGEEAIEEELLLQQIDNIKAYIFDAKHSGRLDEVEVLTENLKELKYTLAKQKEKSNC
ncbi:rabenosyn-5 isoform X1 [Cyanistes caeruleus]|uniref:rabenosyn-5 isoform X1 n=1 Tax=Cyanistes caeruleus TaxID=156563 RepID=UPI000CDAA696|nr:rabenosyn-5 isoform X1 [Cyanistes caeruleus]